MKARWIKLTVVMLALAVIGSILPACQPLEAAESYLAVIPRVLLSGSTESISIALFKGDDLIKSKVEVTLLKDNEEITQVSKTINGKGIIELDIPDDIEEGEYQVRVKGAGFEDEASVLVDASFIVFLETDKPIYKPGQTIHIRTITLTPELKPVVGMPVRLRDEQMASADEPAAPIGLPDNPVFLLNSTSSLLATTGSLTGTR